MIMNLYKPHPAKLVYLSDAGDEFFQRLEMDNKKGEGWEVSVDDTDRLPSELKVRWFDLFCFAFSMTSYVLDIATDFIVAYIHYTYQRYWAFTCIIVLAVSPSILLNLVSIFWSIDDAALARSRSPSQKPSKASLFFLVGIHAIQLGPLIWYIKALHAGLKFRKSNNLEEKRKLYGEMIMADRDASLLRFFEAFLESMPQVLVQGYVLIDIINRLKPEDSLPFTAYFQILSVFTSLSSACWSVSIQHRSLRIARQDKVNMNVLEIFMQLLWRFLTIFSRFLCLVMFTVTYGYWLAAVFIVHYALSILHISALQQLEIDAEPSLKAIRFGLLLICAAVHIFTPFNMAEGPTRWRYLVAYSLEAFEDVVLLVLVLSCKSVIFSAKFAATIAAVTCFVVGIGVMILYYLKFHPNHRASEAIKLPAQNQVATLLVTDVEEEEYVPSDLKHIDSDADL